MAGNGAGSGGGGGGASISAAAVAVAPADARFAVQERRNRWGGCFGGLSCFGSKKGGKRIVPASRVPDGNASTGRGPQSAGPSDQNPNLNLSLLAPPSSPASFTNSALPSTAQSPSCFMSMSANSPGGPTSTMFMTGPYAHETQLVSPPVFSTFTTEPSTAPLTPPPELAHLTTPSSPDVPFAQYLSSASKQNGMPFLSTGYSVSSDLQATYPLYPGSPSSSLISPASGTPRTGLSSPFPEQEVSTQWGTCSVSSRDSSKLFGRDSTTSRNFTLGADSSFFCPAAAAEFYLDQAQQSVPSYPYSGGRLSVSRETDVYSNGGNRHNKTCVKQDEEIEAYRASFGFSADEIITTQNYVEISDPADDSFTMSPFGNNKPFAEPFPETEWTIGGKTIGAKQSDESGNRVHNGAMHWRNDISASKYNGHSDGNTRADGGSIHPLKIGDERLSKSMRRQLSKRYLPGQSCSDAEIEYRRARSLKDAHSMLACRNSPS